MHSSLAQFSFS